MLQVVDGKGAAPSGALDRLDGLSSSPSGLAAVPYLAWGSHVAHFFGSRDELREVLVPYFKAGLENNERCFWVVREPFADEEARSALAAQVLDLAERERAGQIDILSAERFYSGPSNVDGVALVRDLLALESEALAAGYQGLRTNGNCGGVSRDQWHDFQAYESLVQETVPGRRMICMCSYSVDQLQAGSQFDVMERHHVTIPSARRPRTIVADGPVVGIGTEDAFRRALEQQKRTFDRAMTASKMGTWRYTIADNICMYDENAQALYGLTEARFLHDEEGVKDKFHADDMELMWSRVGKALDPQGDGRYDVEYRVKQLDGSWRWLSAWGLVEFEGEGEDRKPVAITGASRDLTEMKAAEELQGLLLNELNHRVKNTLATVQAITAQTLKSADDLPSGREALEQRICSMARAHDLLRAREWEGANLADLANGSLEAFPTSQIQVAGAPVDISPRHALALAMAFHELATNAAKYGALSCPEGCVCLRWSVDDQRTLHLDWDESGGPAVSEPSRKGFGSRLLERLLVRDLGGEIRLDYDPAGLKFAISAPL
jgi:two-component sensor histidine kinase/PAS domain-containing protein